MYTRRFDLRDPRRAKLRQRNQPGRAELRILGTSKIITIVKHEQVH